MKVVRILNGVKHHQCRNALASLQIFDKVAYFFIRDTQRYPGWQLFLLTPYFWFYIITPYRFGRFKRLFSIRIERK